jgi:hypothetical protein
MELRLLGLVGRCVLCLCILVFSAVAEARGPWQEGTFFSRPIDNSSLYDERDLPTCLDVDRSPIARANNEEVIAWKQGTKNQYRDRALIIGKLVGVLLERKSHLQLEVDLTPHYNESRSDNVEIIYNKSFGEVPDVKIGSPVAACGDYITAKEQAGNYPPSPVGAIIHWVHASNNPEKHSSGYLIINGTEYGKGDGGGSGRERRYRTEFELFSFGQ